MGVPKFFRYISERYPNLSELVGTKEVSTIKTFFCNFFKFHIASLNEKKKWRKKLICFCFIVIV